MKKVLITGASSGIGRQLARDYANLGNQVWVSARSESALQEVKKEFPSQIHLLPLDVTSKTDVEKSFEVLQKMDLVILNAGSCEYVDVESFDAQIFERVFNVNLMGVVNCTEVLLPRIKKGGQLAIVGSLARLLPFTRAQAYGGSKAAIHYYTKSLAVDVEEDYGITVHSVSPGFVKTPLTDKNDFQMPFLLEVEDASKRIISGLASKKADVSFPKRLAWTLKFCSLLPETLQHKIALKMKEAERGK